MSTADRYRYQEPDALGHLVAAYSVNHGPGFDEQVIDLFRALRTETGARSVLATVRLFRRFHAFPVPDAKVQDGRLEGGPLRDVDVRNQIFDRVVYISVPSQDEARRVHEGPAFQAFAKAVESQTTDSCIGVYKNTMSYGYVSTDPGKYYLFNFFSTDSRERAVQTWKRTSAWFYDHTDCLSSYNMEAVDESARYGLVNFAHWNQLYRLYLSAVFRRSMKSVVTEGFRHNRMISRPILFREVDLVDRLIRRNPKGYLA